MRVINNLNGTHRTEILALLKDGDEFILVSPFLTDDFDEFIHDVSLSGIKKITLITTLKDNSTDLLNKASSLYNFRYSCFMNKVDYAIRLDNMLHGKIYIAVKDGTPIKGIITSANFTNKGLLSAHEWGIEIDDSDKLQGIMSDLYKCSTAPLSHAELDAIIKAIDDYAMANKPVPESKPHLEIGSLIKAKQAAISEVVDGYDFDSNVRYFLKPVGSAEEPYSTNRVLDRDVQEMHFSKRKPNAVRIGDILICYGVGTTKLLGYFKVVNEPTCIPDDKLRWPWKVDAKNLCPDYSDKWITYENTLSSVQSSYGTNKVKSYVGGKSLGALNFGADRIRLNEDFAKYLIAVIEKSV